MPVVAVNGITIALLLVGTMVVRSAHACSTFLLKGGPTILVGHNLDQDFYTPGAVLINPRGQTRHSRCAADLGLSKDRTAPLTWTSRFGSVTFTILGQGFPDGGINESGLVVCEMALGQSSFPHSPQKPTMFIHQWIQYQLDNYSKISEVLKHLSDINIDPRATFSPVSLANYHFFVADGEGEAATIEFLDGRPVVHSGKSLTVPALCNMPYADEMIRQATFSGLVGSLYRWLDSGSDHRFLICADGLANFDNNLYPDAVDYAFDLLANMQFPATRQWSIVYDVANRSVAFRTAKSPGVKTLRLDAVQFSETAPMRILGDIDAIESGDIAEALQPFNEESNWATIEKFVTSLVRFVAASDTADSLNAYLNAQHDLTLQELIHRAHLMSMSTMSEDFR
jgi:penicillin V acylase-like amidase (Ntn superfamily)